MSFTRVADKLLIAAVVVGVDWLNIHVSNLTAFSWHTGSSRAREVRGSGFKPRCGRRPVKCTSNGGAAMFVGSTHCTQFINI